MKIREMESNPTYSWEQINAVAEWMNYGSADNAVVAELQKFGNNFPKNSKIYTGTCYRAFGLSTKQAYKMLKGDSIKHRPLESWTVSIDDIDNFLTYTYGGSSVVEHDHYIMAVLKAQPGRGEVFLNVTALFNDQEWKSSVEYWESNGKHFDEGLDFAESQNEIVLAMSDFNLQNIVAVVDGSIKTNNIEKRLNKFINE